MAIYLRSASIEESVNRSSRAQGQEAAGDLQNWRLKEKCNCSTPRSNDERNPR